MPLMTWELWLARDIVTDNPILYLGRSLRVISPAR